MSPVLLSRSRLLCKAFRTASNDIASISGLCNSYGSNLELSIGSEHGSNSRTSISALLVAAFHSNFSLGQLCRSPSQEQQSLRRLQLATKIAAWSQCRCMGVAVEAPSPDEEVTMTENAIEKLQELCEGRADQCLRLTVEAGGCSGFSYKFDLDSNVQDNDRVFEARGVRLIADSMSYEFVRGSKVDYSQELIKSSFEVIDNPNAEKGCGCGTSFAPK